MKHFAKFCKQSVKNILSFQILGPSRGPKGNSIKKSYKNIPVKKLMCSNAT